MFHLPSIENMADTDKDTESKVSSPLKKSKASKPKKKDPPATPDGGASEGGESVGSDNIASDNGDDADIENKDKNAANTSGTPNGTKGSAKKPSKSKASKGTSKSYLELVHEAIVNLKDRTGSSQIAIVKYLVATYPNLQANTPHNRFKQHVMTALKSGVKSNRFQKVKASFKINSDWKKKQAAAKKKKKVAEQKKKKDLQKKKEEAAKAAKKEKEEEAKKDPVQAKIDMLREKDPNSQELKKLLADRKRKQEAEARKAYIEERKKKRRFPMEDTALHEEDKELGVKKPDDVGPRPQLPLFFSLTHNEQRPSNSKYAFSASKCEGFEKDSRGLISDLFQVYHFFRGDVHYLGTGQSTSDREIVPEFTLKHLIHSVDDILSGSAKKARTVPPLIVHLFVTCLQILTLHPDQDGGASLEDTPQRRQLQQDFALHLHGALSPTSWSDVCHLYMDAMHRHHTTKASAGKNVLVGLPIDADYLLGTTDEEENFPSTELPGGYTGYLGDPECALSRAHQKLERQDPWLLTAEELMALLRALTDDVLARKPEIGEDMSMREEKMYDLLKAKRAADSKFRKVRLAFEGPKQPPKKTTTTGSADGKQEKDTKQDKDKENTTANDSKHEGNDKNGKEKVEEWKPTATKKQFESAKKAQLKASDAYEKGVRKLMARTEPVGFDRNYNGVYCFRHDPEVLYIECPKPASSSDPQLEELRQRKTTWHVIETKSLFDQYVQSLDKRGKREFALIDELTGQLTGGPSLRRFLFDDIKERAMAAAQIRDKEDLKRKLENAKLKCDEEEGRRSGRLASRAEDELEQIEAEINKLEEKMKTGAVVKELNYAELTGLELLRKYDCGGKIETRRTREKKVAATVNTFQSMNCSKLCSTGNIDGTGFVGMLVSKLLELEEACESLVPWERTDVSRQSWISDLENLVYGWNAGSPVIVGPMDSSFQLNSPKASTVSTPVSAFSEMSKGTKKRPSSMGGSADSKRSKTEDFGSSSQSYLTVSQTVAGLRRPLLDLEKRVYEITGLAIAAQDVADADDNMSASGEDEDEEKDSKEKRAWKKLVHKLRNMPSKKHAAIREIVVNAIAAARKAQLKAVVGQLRAALLEYHPNAAGTCKAAAVKVLDEHGGYEMEDEDEDEEDEEEEKETSDDAAETEEQEIPSALSADAVIVNSSLDGIEDAEHVDWVDAVKAGKTLSRMATLVTAFVKKAKTKLNKASEEYDALTDAVAIWEKEEERRLRSEAKNGTDKPQKKPASLGVSEVWANVEFTSEMAMVMVDPYPWWPAKKCVAKDAKLEASLKSVNRCLVSLVGESGAIRVVQNSAVRPYTGKLVEEEEGIDMSDLTKETKTQLDDCMAMARRVLRAKEAKKTAKKKG